MWVAYIDESGQPNFHNMKEELFYTVSALILHDSRIEELNNQVEKIKKETLPSGYRNVEIRASEIVHGNKKYKGLEIDKRIRLMDRLHEYIRDNDNITIISVVMDKRRIANGVRGEVNLKRGIVADKTREQIYKLLIERLAWFITNIEQNRGSKWMLLVIDESTISHQKRTTRDLDREKQVGIYTSRIPGSKHILTPPLFVPSSRHVGIQLADLIAYTTAKWISKKYYGRVDKNFDFDKYFNLISNRLYKNDKGNYSGYGLKYWDLSTYLK